MNKPQRIKAEKRLRRALLKAFSIWRSRINMSALETALRNGDKVQAMRVINRANLEDTLVPVERIVYDLVLKGGKSGITLVNKVVG